MPSEKIPAAAVKAFDRAMAQAVNDVMAAFAVLGVPDDGTPQHLDMRADVRRALRPIFDEWM